MKALVLLGFMAFHGPLKAQEKTPDSSEMELEIKKSDYSIDWKYHAGAYLIYDCRRAHYACVNNDGNETCREERAEAMNKKEKSYPCAPLKKFANKKECVKENYKVVDLGAKRRFCYPK